MARLIPGIITLKQMHYYHIAFIDSIHYPQLKKKAELREKL